MSCEIINLAERRRQRLVRIVRRPGAINPYGFVIPVAGLICLVLWSAVIVNAVSLYRFLDSK
jgi:hypothetical protein